MKQTSREKAEELVIKMSIELFPGTTLANLEPNFYIRANKYAIECAIICCKEILNLDNDDVYVDCTFWENVLYELEHYD